jgi:hypothetical protein
MAEKSTAIILEMRENPPRILAWKRKKLNLDRCAEIERQFLMNYKPWVDDGHNPLQGRLPNMGWW